MTKKDFVLITAAVKAGGYSIALGHLRIECEDIAYCLANRLADTNRERFLKACDEATIMMLLRPYTLGESPVLRALTL